MSPLVSALVAIAALRGTIDASDRTEVRVRNANDGSTVVDLETTLNLLAALRSRAWEFKLGYTPRITQRGDIGFPPDFLHGVTLGVGYTARRASLSVYEEGSYGRQTWTPFLADPTLAPGPIRLDTLPANQVVNYASSRTGMLAKLAPTRRWALGLTLEYALSGGADAGSRASIPLQAGPRGTFSAEYAVTRRDRLASTFGASWTGFSNGPEDILVQATESWRHALGRNTESTIGGGAAWAKTRDGAGAAFRSLAHPIAEITIAHSVPSLHIDGRVTARLAPVIDPATGHVDERVDANGALIWNTTRSLSITGVAGATQSISWDEPGAVTMVYHGLTVAYRVSKIVQIDTGTRGFWWSMRGGDAAPPQWVVFAGLTLTAPQLRF